MKKRITVFSFSQKDHAVSEIVGTLILIVIAVTTFSAVALIVINPWSNFLNVETPNVFLVGSIHNNDVIIEHQCGIPLDKNTKLNITI